MIKRIHVAPLLVFASLGLYLFNSVQHSGKNNIQERKEIKRPSEWFYAQRAYPAGYIPHEAIIRARKQAQLLKLSSKDTFTWRKEGPYNIGGRITSIAVNPLNENVFYVGTADGGVFKTTDRGSTFVHVFNDALTLSIGALAIDPNDTSCIYVGTGESNASGDSFDGDGVYVSHDGGNTYEYLGLPNCGRVGDIVVHPDSSNIVYVACMGYLFTTNPERGVYRTKDGGATWQKVLYVDDTTGCIDIEINPVHPDTIFAAMWHRIRTPEERRVGGVTSGIYRSTDGGDTWQRLTYNLPQGDTVGRIGIALSKSNPSVIYAVYADHPGYFMGVFKSTDGGDTWFDLPTDYINDVFSSYGWFFGRIYVDPYDENTVYVAGLYIYRSTNGGDDWEYFASYYDNVHVDHHAFYIGNSFILDGNDGGLYRRDSASSSWFHYENLPITQFYDIALDIQNPDRLYGGTQDNGTIRRKNYSLDNWELIYYGDGFHVAVDPRDYRVIFAEYQWGGLGKSTDDGASWQDATGGIDPNDRTNWDTPYTLDPVNPDIMYLGTYRIYKSYNGAGSWAPKSPDLTNGGGKLIHGTITVVHVNRTDNRFVFAGTDDGNVWYSPDSAGTWIKISDSLPLRYVTDIKTLPENPGVIFVSLSGYELSEHVPYIFMSSDTGGSWLDITYNLPQAPCNAIEITYDSMLFVGTDVGVYYMHMGDTLWNVLGNGLPNAVIMDMKIDSVNNILYVGTHGLGIYSVQVPHTAIRENNMEKHASWVALRKSTVTRNIELKFMGILNENIRVTLYDVQGRMVSALYNGRVKRDLRLGIPHVRNGMYLLNVRSERKYKTFKIIIERR